MIADVGVRDEVKGGIPHDAQSSVCAGAVDVHRHRRAIVGDGNDLPDAATARGFSRVRHEAPGVDVLHSTTETVLLVAELHLASSGQQHARTSAAVAVGVENQLLALLLDVIYEARHADQKVAVDSVGANSLFILNVCRRALHRHDLKGTP